jgi:hypothetical protein
MTRLILALVAWLSLVPVASASLAPRKSSTRLDNYVPPAKASRGAQTKAPEVPASHQAQAAAQETTSEFAVTEQTEVTLNGKPCRYKDVPSHASILRMELGADKKTVRKIHFRTRK